MTDLKKTDGPTADSTSQSTDDQPTGPSADATGGPVIAASPTAGTQRSSPDVSLNRGALGAVKAGDVVVSVGAIGAARADRISIQVGSIGAAAAREIRVSTGGVGAIAGQNVQLQQSLVRTVVAQRVTLGRGAGAGIVVAARVDGDGRALLDWRGGLAAGTIFALVWLVVRRLR
jgi:hypothetical protein